MLLLLMNIRMSNHIDLIGKCNRNFVPKDVQLSDMKYAAQIIKDLRI
jgi:hypothetical protein